MKEFGQNTELEYGKNKSRSCELSKSATMFGGDVCRAGQFSASRTSLTTLRTPMAMVESGCK